MSGNIAFKKERKRERNDLPGVERSQSYAMNTLFSVLSEKTFATFNTNVSENERERKKEGKRQLSMSN